MNIANIMPTINNTVNNRQDITNIPYTHLQRERGRGVSCYYKNNTKYIIGWSSIINNNNNKYKEVFQDICT